MFHPIKNVTVVEELTAEVNSKRTESYVNLLTKYALLKFEGKNIFKIILDN